MYSPPPFAETDLPRMHALMRAHPLATLVSAGAAGPEASHVPLLLDAGAAPNGILRGHVARANPLWRGIDAGAGVLAIFHGPQAYVSPSWYASKREHGKVVPTWNYVTVHARGTLRVIEDAGWLYEQIGQLTATQEAGFAQPWSVDDAPAGFTHGLLGAIVGIEIAISALSGTWKLSQNRGASDRRGVIAGLRAGHDGNARAVAGMMEQQGLADD